VLKQDNGEIAIDDFVLSVPELKTIVGRDASETKETAKKELLYVYYMVDFRSPYKLYSQEKKDVALKGYADKKDKDIQSAVDAYRDIRDSMYPSIGLLEDALYAVGKLREYFRDIDFKKKTKTGAQVYTAKDLATNLEKLGKIIETIEILKEQADKDSASITRIKGHKQIRDRER
jgi:hypothetical protein